MDEITESPEVIVPSLTNGSADSASSQISVGSSARRLSGGRDKHTGFVTEPARHDMHREATSVTQPLVSIPLPRNGQQDGHGLPPRHRMQRSAVRPFLCCGSELSLVSLMDNLEVTGKEQTSGVCSIESTFSLSDYEETSTDQLLPYSQSCIADPSAACASSGNGTSQSGAMVRRIKNDKHKSKKRFWSLRFRSKWPRGLRFIDRSRQMACCCEGRKCGLGVSDGVCEAEVAGCGGASSLKPAAVKGRGKGKVQARRASMVNLPRVSEFDRMFPINGNEEILARERARELRLATDMEARMFAFPGGPALRAVAFGASATSSAMGLVSSHSVGHLRASPEGLSGEHSSIYTDFTPVNMLQLPSVEAGSLPLGLVIHTQVDYIHYLVPDLQQITNCSFYWGVIDRYEAERLLDKKREGTFLLRDSAQDDFLFSVSFRRYNRSLHARIEQWNHRFSFDVHDPAVFSSDSVCSLIEHYKDSSRCLFFEPMLTEPLHRTFPFSLQHLARAVISTHMSYDAIHHLPLPNSLKEYIRYYHYKQKVCVRRFECTGEGIV